MATKFKYVKNVIGYVNGYRGNKVKTGDIVELDDTMAVKAAFNPDYELVRAKKASKPKLEPKIEEPKAKATETETAQ